MNIPKKLNIEDIKDGKCLKDILAIDLNDRSIYHDMEYKRQTVIVIDIDTLKYLLLNEFYPDVRVYNRKSRVFYEIEYIVSKDNYTQKVDIEIAIAKTPDTFYDKSSFEIDMSKFEYRDLKEDESLEMIVDAISLKQKLLASSLDLKE